MKILLGRLVCICVVLLLFGKGKQGQAVAQSIIFQQSTTWTSNNHSYVYVAFNQSISWSWASNYSSNAGGYMVSLETTAENDFVALPLLSTSSTQINYWTYFKNVLNAVWMGPFIGLQRVSPSSPCSPWNGTWTSGQPFTFDINNWLNFNSVQQPDCSGTAINFQFSNGASGYPTSTSNIWGDGFSTSDTTANIRSLIVELTPIQPIVTRTCTSVVVSWTPSSACYPTLVSLYGNDITSSTTTVAAGISTTTLAVTFATSGYVTAQFVLPSGNTVASAAYFSAYSPIGVVNANKCTCDPSCVGAFCNCYFASQ